MQVKGAVQTTLQLLGRPVPGVMGDTEKNLTRSRAGRHLNEVISPESVIRLNHPLCHYPLPPE